MDPSETLEVLLAGTAGTAGTAALPYTGDHIRRVVGYSQILGLELNVDRQKLDQIRLAATLHDIGKIAVPDSILGKPTELKSNEKEIIRRHPIDGWEIIAHIHELKEILPAVRGHHERLDGAGYPDGLTGDEIPLIARVIAVADTFDAMTTDRPYRRGLRPEQAAHEIYKNAGTQFCPVVVKAFRNLFERGEFSTAQGAENRPHRNSRCGSSLRQPRDDE